jgi:hypothetical protein
MNLNTRVDSSPTPTRSRAKRILFWVAAISGIMVLFVAQENWRGRRALEKQKQALQAQGEVLDYAHSLPPSVPEAENFAKTPLLVAIGYKDSVDSNEWNRISSIAVGSYTRDMLSGQRNDLEGCQAYLRSHTNVTLSSDSTNPAADVVQGMESLNQQFDELRAATQRAYAQFPADPSTPFHGSVPNFVAIRCLSQDFSMLASAKIALGKADEALADLQVIGKLVDALEGQPTLVSAMIRVAVSQLYMQGFWEGCGAGQWKDHHLRHFQERFKSVHLVKAVDHALHVGERNGILLLVEKSLASGSTSPFWVQGEPTLGERLEWLLIPHGWIRQDLANYCRVMQSCGLTRGEVSALNVSPSALDRRGEALLAELESPWHKYHPYWRLTVIGVPNLVKAHRTAIRNETVIQQAIIVCGLERYRMARGKYPERLVDLPPEFLDAIPHDPIGGQAMRYESTQAGDFLLYSIGWNEKDDGGKPAFSKEGLPSWSFSEGDWVWPSKMAKSTEVRSGKEGA